MRATDEMKALEVDLSGANIRVIMEPVDKQEFSQKYGFFGVEEPKSLQGVVQRYLRSGRSYVVLEDPVVLDTQMSSADFFKSMYFYYTPGIDNPDVVILWVKGGGYSETYDEVAKVSFRELHAIAERRSVNFTHIPNSVQEVYTIEKFKSELSPESVEVPKPSSKQIAATPTVSKAVKEEAEETKEATAAKETSGEKWLPIPAIKVARKLDRKDNIVPPAVRWVALEDYELSRLEEDLY